MAANSAALSSPEARGAAQPALVRMDSTSLEQARQILWDPGVPGVSVRVPEPRPSVLHLADAWVQND